MEFLTGILSLALLTALAVVAAALAWWLFRMAFWLAILFVGEAGRAWRGHD